MGIFSHEPGTSCALIVRGMSVTLGLDASGPRMPLMGLGTWHLEKESTAETVQEALRIGYRHIGEWVALMACAISTIAINFRHCMPPPDVLITRHDIMNVYLYLCMNLPFYASAVGDPETSVLS